MRPTRVVLLASLALRSWCGEALAADAGATVFSRDAEALPTCVHAKASRITGADGGAAVRFDNPAARMGAQLKLEPGTYRLVFRALAPSGSQDAFYFDAAGQTFRIAIGEFERWVVRAQPFEVKKAGSYSLALRPDVNELGLAIDQVALVRGTLPDIRRMQDLPKPTGQVALKPLVGVVAAQRSAANAVKPEFKEFKMAALPAKPHGRGLDTLFYCSFDESRDADYARGNGGCGLVAGGKLTTGKWGKALDCTDEKVNMFYNLHRNLVSRAGTLECWVKSGEQNIWNDGKQHCLFYLRPRRMMPHSPRAGLTIELTKRGKDNAFHFVVSGAATADLAVPTADLDPNTWHHLAFSWDFTGKGVELRFAINGRGRQATVPARAMPTPFDSLQVGNFRWYGHHAHANEFRPFGGLVDDLHTSDETLARREAGHKPLDIGPLDLQTGLAAEDALRKWLDKWAGLQAGGAWGSWITPMIDRASNVSFDWTKQPSDRHWVDMKYGSSALLSTYFLEAYEYTGDERWLRVAQNTGHFFLAGQSPKGYWYQAYVVDEVGGVAPTASTNWARVQDGYQSQPWLFMLYMHRVTGDERYLKSATRCADFLLSIENPNGSWPGKYDAVRGVGWTTGGRGVDYGCEYNDFATTDPMRMMITMYHLTGDEKYLKGSHGKGIAGIGQWMFDTQMGQGKVRGWCQQYGQDNKPVWSRAFEAPVMSPRVVCRFIHPMCLWLYLMTGQERYMKLLQETYDWYRSVEVPGPKGGWYYQYLPDGTPVTTSGYRTVKIDPKDPKAPKPSRGKLQLTGLERTLKRYQELGPEKFRKSFSGKVQLTANDIAARRKSAAAYCRSQAKAVLEEVKTQRADGTLRPSRLLRQPQGVRVYRYVLNLHLARGVVPASPPPRGGESPWRMGRGWKIPVIWLEDWFDVPLK